MCYLFGKTLLSELRSRVKDILTGPLLADLFVSTTGTDANYMVKLIDVFPHNFKALTDKKTDIPLGGYQMLVRQKYSRAGTEKTERNLDYIE